MNLSKKALWKSYSKKLASKIESPKCGGFFLQSDAAFREMRVVVGKEGKLEEGRMVALYWLVDPSDGVIADARFQVFGPSALIGAAEAACEILLRKNYDQARRVTADLIDKQMRDRSNTPAFPEECAPLLNLVLDAIDHAADQCMDIPFAETYVSTPLHPEEMPAGQAYPNWKELNKKQKIAVIEEVIANDVRPYIELDAGGVRILDLVNECELIIAYEGACTTCYSSTGATLNSIQQILRAKIDPGLIVTPDLTTRIGS